MQVLQRTSASTRHGPGGRQTPSTLSKAILCALLAGCTLPVAHAQEAEAGQHGDPESWRSEEFMADWGLGAIGAEHAYARGLSGKGIRVGIFDSGSALAGPEFSGKDNLSIHIADLFGDGSTCSNSIGLTDADCFSSDGDQPVVSYFEYTDTDRALIAQLVEAGYLFDWVPEYLESLAGFSYQSHGTHVAGTMAANRDGFGTHGVAYGSDVATARLFSNNYSDLYTLLDVPGGESYAIGPDASAISSMYEQMLAAGVRVINHSWGLIREPKTVEEMDELYGSFGVIEYFSTYADPSLENGTLQVFAAGNDTPIAGAYATLPRLFPELEKYWLSVVNMNQDGVIDGSSAICGLSKDWCVTAPGTDITSTIVEGQIDGSVVRDEDGNFVGLDITGQDPEYGYGDMTGTSMAAPHVTGALALLMERFPYLDNPQIRDVLLTTATDLGDEGVDEVFGWGLVDLRKAIEGPGQFRVDTNVVMNQRAGGTKVWEGLAWDDWTNDIGGPGRLTKSGIGWLRLSGDNTFAGATIAEGVLELDGSNQLTGDVQVDGGFFVLNGSLQGSDLLVNGGYADIQGLLAGGTTTVGVGGKLGGVGTLGDTVVAGTIAPGNSIGTLTVDGNYIQQAGSFYEVELEPPSFTDLLRVTGTATLEGGTVKATRQPGVYNLGQSYNILSAAGGVSGTFASLDASAISPFLKLTLAYAPDKVMIDVTRGQSFASAGGTYNQVAAGAGVDGMADDNGVVQALVQLFPQQAMAAVDALSGDLHASTQSVLIDGSRHVRNAALARAGNGLDAFTAQSDDDKRAGAWVEMQRNGGQIHSDGNASGVDYSGNTTLVGADYQFDGGWRVGVLGGTGDSDMKALERNNAKADFNTRLVGIYAGQNWGGFGLRAGVTYGWHEVKADRTVAFTGFTDALHARYDATSRQGFIEAGYRFGGDTWGIEPYAQFAQVRVDSDAFQESGEAAALSGKTRNVRADLTTGGVRFNVNLGGAQQEQTWLSLRGGVGYRKTGGELVPGADMALRDGAAFNVHGAPVASDAILAELGMAARTSRNSLLELGYNGQFADEGNDHGVNARFSLRF